MIRVLAQGAGDEERPDPSRLVSGDPVHRSWVTDEGEGLMAGIWESTPGAWRVAYDEWEYCRILAGRSVLTSDTGEVMDVGPGDSFVIRPGFTGVWEVVETTRKDFVIRF